METLTESLPQISLFGNVLAFWGLTLGLFITVFILDFKEESVASISCIAIFAVLVYFWGDIEAFAFLSLKNAGYYFLVGVVFALIRTYLHGIKKLKYNGYASDPSTAELKSNLEKQEDDKFEGLKDNVLRWWSLWPISLFNWLLTDFIRQIGSWIYDRFNKVFEGVFNLGKKHR